MTKPPLGIPGSFGGAICEALERRYGPVDIILIAAKEGTDFARPEFITSVHPDVCEAVIQQLADQINDGSLGTRHVK